MALSTKYGKIEISNIPEYEPVFVIRAQDKLAIQAIEKYQLLAESNGAQITETVKKDIENFKNWQGVKKLPD